MKQQREQAENILKSSSTSINDVIEIGGTLGKRLEREIRRAEQTGRVSNWLAGETIKAEAAKNAAQQSAFNRAVIDVVSTLQPSIQIGQQSSYRPTLGEKPTVRDATSIEPNPWDLFAKVDPDADPEDPNPPYIVTVAAGTLNGILPSNYDDEFSCTNNGLYYAIAKIQTDGHFINGLTIDITTTPPVQQTAELFGLSLNIDYLFGLFSGGLIYNIAQGNIVLNTDLVMVQTVSPIPAVGESLYNLYYRLQ